MPDTLLVVNARILTLRGPDGPRRDAAMRDLGVIERGWVRIDGDRITDVGPGHAPEIGDDEPPLRADVLDAAGAVVMPAFVDCHTHACWTGSRHDEFEMKLAGRPYLDILKAGGGIMSTVRAVRAATAERLEEMLEDHLERMRALGTGLVEVKSGYGLDVETELRMLRVIHEVALGSEAPIIGTFLGAHAKDPDDPDLVDRIIEEALPAVASEFPGITCDAYCEEGAWSLEECRRLFETAAEHDLPIRVHADQFNPLGMTTLAVEMGAVSVDHLEASTEEGLAQLAESNTMGVMLPCCGFHLDDRYADGRRFLDMGGALAIATNYNPGSAPTPSMPFTISLACRRLGLTPAEAITCATWNAACVLGVQDRVGALRPGARADLQILDADDERDLAFELAGPGPLAVVLGGRLVHARGLASLPAEWREDPDDED